MARSFGLAVLAAGLLAASFQPLNLGPVLGWVALTPLLYAVRGASHRQALAAGAAFGVLVNGSLLASLWPIPGLHWHQLLVLSAYLACYPAVWCALMARGPLRSPWLPWFGASVWVLLDYLRANAGFLAFPVGSLAQTQVDDLWLLQVASLGGEYAVTFLVVLGNVVAWQLLQRVPWRPLAGAALLLGAAFAFGAGALPRARTAGPGAMTVAVLQTDFAAFGPAHVPTAERMLRTLEFLRDHPPSGATLAVLPETSFVNPAADPALLAALQRVADRGPLTLVAGVAQATKFDRDRRAVGTPDRTVRAGAWIFDPGGSAPRRYDKVHRLPFAEYLPAPGWMAWPAWLVPPPLEVVAGPAAHAFPTAIGAPIGVMVCWESVFADHARELARAGAGLLLQLSNEGWFHGTAAGLKHNATVRLRAVETRTPTLAAVNAGPAIIIDGYGRILARGAEGAPLEWVTAVVAPRARPSPYSRLGDWFVALSALVAALSVLASAHRSGTRT